MNDFFSDPNCLATPRVNLESRDDGTFVISSLDPLRTYARCIGEWLERWAAETPAQVFLAERRSGSWFSLSYQEVRNRVRSLAQGLLGLDLVEGCPVLMLSDNDVDQALLSLAAMHIGVPVSTVSVAYSRSTADGCSKLRSIIEVLKPGVIFVNDGDVFARTIELAQPKCMVVAARNAQAIPGSVPMPLLYKSETPAVMQAFQRIGHNTPARYLLTSGSTGTPKAVINTHGMLCANQQAIAQCWPFVEKSQIVVLDWLPWSHTFGANHNFNLVLRNGGSLYIDDGRPVPGQIQRTVENIKSVRPTMFFNVPRGFDALLPFLERDNDLAQALFGRLDMLFYGAAALPQSTWERLIICAQRAREKPLFFATEWGASETSPVLTNVHFHLDKPGNIGLPIPGIDIKFAPAGDKLEMRVRGPSVFRRYLNDDQKTAEAFDEEGFYCTGDAGRMIDPAQPARGIQFDGRVSEDFKLTTGTWVSVGTLRPRLASALAPYANDCVICGHDQDVVGALVYPTPALQALVGEKGSAMNAEQLAMEPEVRLALCAGLRALAKDYPASSKHVVRLIVLDTPPSLEAGEITDKGYINQRTALSLRADQVKRLYADSLDPAVILLAEAFGESR